MTHTPMCSSLKTDARKRPTLRQVAKAAGVSLMTASRAMRNQSNVLPAVAARVRRAAEAAGYRPDPRVAALMSHLRSRRKATFTASIAAITGITEQEETGQARLVREHARLRAEELGFRLELFRVARPDVPDRRLERALINRGIDGVLLLRMRAPVAVDRLLDWARFPVVSATASVGAPAFARVGPDYFSNARVLCAKLAAAGRKRIGFVGTETYCARTNDALPAALAWHGATVGAAALRPLVFARQQMDRAALRRWFARERPDAIILYSQEHVEAVSQELGSRDADPVWIGCADVDPTQVVCSGINERPDLIGAKAIGLLAGMLHQNERGAPAAPVNMRIEGVWVEA